jgi:two-component sensor histidine kinase
MPDSVLDIIHRLTLARSEDEIAVVVSQAARTLLQADGATFALREGDQCYYAAEDAVSPLWKDRRLPMSGCIAGWCMTHGQCASIADIHQDPRMLTAVFRPAFVRSMAVAPVGRGESVAALGAYWSEQHRPQPEELERLQAIADAASLALASLRLQHPGSPEARAMTEPTEASADHRASFRTALERFLHDGLRPNSLQAHAMALTCILIATLLRWGVQMTGVEEVSIFSFYYPPVVIALLVGGRPSAVLAAAAGGVAAIYLFMPPHYAFSLATLSDALNLGLYTVACSVIILAIDWHQRLVSRLKTEDARHLTLAREQQHRARNAVAIVDVIVRRSLPNDSAQAGSISRRIRAVFADIDVHLRTRPIRMAKLLAHELEPYDLGNFTFDGDVETMVMPEATSVVSLAIHELAINALKYGSLSVPGGQATVAWRISENGLRIRWSEAAGPLVHPPLRRGYGSVLLVRLIEAAGGTVSIQFPPTGLTAEISLPTAAVERLPATALQTLSTCS